MPLCVLNSFENNAACSKVKTLSWEGPLYGADMRGKKNSKRSEAVAGGILLLTM